MKKACILIISIAMICVGCTSVKNQPVPENIIQAASHENETIASLSPDGKYLAEAYGTNKNITAAGLYPYEGIRVVNAETNEVLFEMPGYYQVDFIWSPNGRHVGIYYEARIYGDSIIFDTKQKRTILLPVLQDIAPHYGESMKPQENRPDPYFHIVEWEDDETVVVDFRWNRENAEYFSGSFSFNIYTRDVTYKQ